MILSFLAFQTFKLPKAPLTYFNSAGETPPEVPELQIYVAGRRWTRVPSMFGRGAKEEIYIVREDADVDAVMLEIKAVLAEERERMERAREAEEME